MNTNSLARLEKVHPELFYVEPESVVDDISDCSATDAVGGGDLTLKLPGLVKFSNLSNFFVGQFGVGPSNAKWHQSMRRSVVFISLACHVLQIIQAWIKLIPINVVDLHRVGARPNKGLSHQAVYKSLFRLIIYTKRYSRIAIMIRGTFHRRHKSRTSIKFYAPNVTVIRDFVGGFIANNGFPDFHLERIS